MIDFTLEIQGLNPMTEYLSRTLPKKIEKENRIILDRIGKIVVKRAQALSPRKSGALERAINFKIGKTVGGQQITVSVRSNVDDYAGYMHDGRYRLGPISRMKPGAGRKFIERAIKENKAKIVRMHEEMLEKIAKADSAR
jgi:HK97 gp10 family phage protein